MTAPAKVYGVADTMRALRDIEPALKREAIKTIKYAAEPLRAGIQAAVPSEPPLSGMDHRGRTGWGARGATTVKTKYGGRRSQGADTWPLVSLVLSGAAGSIYDMAGRGSGGSTPQGSAMVGGLNAAGGLAARASWPQVESKIVMIQAAVLKAVDQVEDQANGKLNDKPSGVPLT